MGVIELGMWMDGERKDSEAGSEEMGELVSGWSCDSARADTWCCRILPTVVATLCYFHFLPHNIYFSNVNSIVYFSFS